MAEKSRPDRRFVFLLNVAQRRLQRWVAAQAPDSGATAAQSGLLLVLGQRDGVLMGEAGAALDLGPPGISGLVDRMMAAKLIQRRPDPEDGRAWRLWLTPAGRAALAETESRACPKSTRASPTDLPTPSSTWWRAGSPVSRPDFPKEKSNDGAYQDRKS